MVADNERLAARSHWPMFQPDGNSTAVTQIDAPEFALAIQQFFEYTHGMSARTYRNMTAVWAD